MKPGGMSDLTIPEYDPPPTVTRISHDPLCPACSTRTDCNCECLCDFIADVRDDERRVLSRVLPEGRINSASQAQSRGI